MPNSNKSTNSLKGISKQVLKPKIMAQKNKSAKEMFTKSRGIIHINSLPHGFYEDQLKNYFGQFGDVTRVRVARSKRTGNSKGYAFVEFKMPEVAQIAAETMNNKLMFKKLLKVAYIAPENQKFDYFRGGVKMADNGDGFSKLTNALKKSTNEFIKNHNKNIPPLQIKKKCEKLEKKLKRLQDEYDALGILVDTTMAVYKKPSTSESPGSAKQMKRKLNAENKIAASKKSKSSISLECLLNETLNGETDSEDSDFDPSHELDETTDFDINTDSLLNDSLNDNTSSDDSEFSARESSDDEVNSDDSTASIISDVSVDKLAKLSKKAKLLGGITKKKNLPGKKIFNKKSSLMVAMLKGEAGKMGSKVKRN